jgi:hypothetical protein
MALRFVAITFGSALVTPDSLEALAGDGSRSRARALVTPRRSRRPGP